MAALFALHPLQVESVAWVAERKNVLSTLFFLLTVWAYARYAEVQSRRQKAKVPDQRTKVSSPWSMVRGPQSGQPSSAFYVLTLAFFALGLMSKPMLVTLPFVLLLLDYWPLQRVRCEDFKSASGTVLRLVWEKLPFFVLSALSCGVTYWAQSKGAAMAAMAGLPVAARVQNAVVSYARYLGKLLWPRGPGGFLSPSGALAVGGGGGSGFDLCRLVFSGGVVVPAGGILGGGTVLVLGDAGAGDRAGASGRAVPRGPVYVCACHWRVHHSGVGLAGSGDALAAVQDARRGWGRW